LGSPTALGATTISPAWATYLLIQGGVLDLNGYSPTVDALVGWSGGEITDNSSTPGVSTLTLDLPSVNSNSTPTVIVDGPNRQLALVLEQFGSGTSPSSEMLTGNNTYTGGTKIDANCALILYGSGRIQGNVTIETGGLLQYEQNVDSAPSLTLQGSGQLVDNGAAGTTLDLRAVNVDNFFGSIANTGAGTLIGP
jgi:hypothetical protein